MNKENTAWRLMEGNVGHLSLSSTDEDSPYDTPRSTENSLSPTSPPKFGSQRGSSGCSHCSDTLLELRSLPCLHSLCQACLQVKGKNVLCVECQLEFPLSNTGLLGLVPDNGSSNFLQSINKRNICTNCRSDNVEAVGKCLDCNLLLCSNCMITHSLFFCGHKVVDIHRNNDEAINEEVVLHCQQHPTEFIKYYCPTCNLIMCHLCFEETHLETNHFVEDINAVGGALVNSLMEKVKDSKTHMADFEYSIKCNNQTLWSLHNQYSEIATKIHQIYEHHSAQLLKYKEQQLSILETVYNRMVSAVRTNTRLKEDSASRLNRIVELLSRLLYYGNNVQCLTYKKLLENEVANFYNVKAKPLQCSLRYDTDDADFVNNLPKNFGRVIYEINGMNNESPISIDQYVSKLDLPAFPFRYEKWSNSGFDDMKALSELNICDDNNHIPRPYHIKSNISRVTITYNWKFGAYGSLQGQFTEPNGVCINSDGDIIIADTNNNRVQVFDRSGKFKFSFGDGNNGDNGTLLFPNRVAVMEKSGDIVVTERAPTHQVQIYNQYGQFIRKFGAAILLHPRAVTVDKEGHIIVVECKVMRVIIFDIMGNIKHKFTCLNILHFPNGVAVNEKQEIFISDNRTHSVLVFNYQGKQLRKIGHEGLTNYPIGVMLNKAGNVIVADNHNNFNLTVFTQDGQLVTAMESKVKHAQCYDAAISPDGVVALTSKDYRVYVYLTSF